MKALVVERNLPRFAAARVASVLGSGRGAGIGPLRLLDAVAPDRPGAGLAPAATAAVGHLRLRPGHPRRAQLALLRGHGVSFPFVPGHEVVGVLDDGGTDHAGRPLAPGTRVVMEPVLGCAPRPSTPPARRAAAGHTGLCGNWPSGTLAPGLQTGFCADTGGGWSTGAAGGPRQPAPRRARRAVRRGRRHGRTDGLRRARRPGGRVADGDMVAVLGAGTLGLTTVAALHTWSAPPRRARGGRGQAPPPTRAGRLARRRPGRAARPAGPGRPAPGRSLVLAGRLTGGADVVFDCVGSSARSPRP